MTFKPRICKTHGVLDKKDIASHLSKRISKKTGERLITRTCKICNSIKANKFNKQNPDRVFVYNQKSIAKNKKKRLQRALSFNKSPEGKQYQKKYTERIKKELHDTYIKRLLHTQLNIKKKDIPKPLIDLKRHLIKLKQMIDDKEINS